MCAGTLATEAKTSGKYHHFQVKFYVFTGPATIIRSHRNSTCSLTGENEKGNCGKILHIIDHLSVREDMRCHREDPDAVYNIIQGWVLRATVGPSTAQQHGRGGRPQGRGGPRGNSRHRI